MSVFTTPPVNQRPSNLLTGSHNVPPLPPSLCEEVQGYVFGQCVTGGGGDREPQTDKHLPTSTFTGKVLRKANIQGLVSLQIFGPCSPTPSLCPSPAFKFPPWGNIKPIRQQGKQGPNVNICTSCCTEYTNTTRIHIFIRYLRLHFILNFVKLSVSKTESSIICLRGF